MDFLGDECLDTVLLPCDDTPMPDASSSVVLSVASDDDLRAEDMIVDSPRSPVSPGTVASPPFSPKPKAKAKAKKSTQAPRAPPELLGLPVTADSLGVRTRQQIADDHLDEFNEANKPT